MSFLDKFFGGTNKSSSSHSHTEPSYTFYESPDDDNTGMFYELTNNNAQKDISIYYDTTRIFIYNDPQIIAGTILQRCLVSWYNYKNTNGNEINYEYVLADINMDQFQKNKNYRLAVMKDLFSIANVHVHLIQGLTESPITPCGNYIGGIRGIHPYYELDFIPSIGKAVHDSPQMQNRRNRTKLPPKSNNIIPFDPMAR